MTRRIVLVLLGTLAFSASGGTVYAWIGPLDIVMPGLPSPTDVVGLIDALTRKDSKTTVDIKVGDTVGQGKLLVARTRVDVAMERSSCNWRGRVHVYLTVPSEITFSVDLQEIRPEHIRLDAKQRLLIVAMPMPKVDNVTPILAEVKTDNTFKRCRFKFLDKHTSHELQNTMLKEDYLARARQKGEMQLPEIRQQARGVLRVFLQRLIGGSSPGVMVVVE
jgi:hypothetical protein